MLRLSACLLWLGCVALSAQAVTFTVDATDDLPDSLLGDGLCASSLGSCTLRAAIMEANLNTFGSSLITVPQGTYLLSIAPQGTNDAGSGDLNLAALPGTNILIQGAGPGRTIVDANQLDTVFRVEDHAEAMLSGLTIRNGLNTSVLAGNGVHSTGTVTVVDANIENNTAVYGGGIYSDPPDNSSSVTLINTTVQHNQAVDGFGGSGGGIAVYAGELRLYNSTVNNNAARNGGGIFNAATSFVVNSTIANNTADEDGGGIYNLSNLIFVYNTTITGNDSDHDQDDVGGFGGGINNRDPARFGIVNSLLSNNTVRFVPVESNCSGTFELYGTNLASNVDITCETTNANFALLTSSLIGPLQDNGGPTFTQALLSGSEAIDGSIDALGCVDERGAALALDQRGANRPAGARCDIGAYEYGAVAPVTDLLFSNGFD